MQLLRWQQWWQQLQVLFQRSTLWALLAELQCRC